MSEQRDRAIEIVGHGGAGDFFPGNSRSAIEKALEIGVDRIEIDVQISADGDLVLVHDERLNIRGRKTPVDEITTRQLRTLLPEVLTFSELMDLVGGRVPLLLDVKLPGYEREVATAIRDHGLGSTAMVSSTHILVLNRLRRAVPELRTGLSTGHMATGHRYAATRVVATRALRVLTPVPLIQAARLVRATEVVIQHLVCTPWLVRRAREEGFRVYVWTVDRPSSIRRAVSLGVDGIISNRPDLVKDIIAGRM
ncbi:MAG TPA: glycerophosphodiester phosphodiesterase [Thermomicrobiales bacterium]